MIKLYGNISTKLDCDALINECKKNKVIPCTGHMEFPSDSKYYDEYKRQTDAGIKAGYTSIEFTHYYPKKHYDNKFTEIFESFTNTTHFLSVVSEIKPGKCAPWHWDIPPPEFEEALKNDYNWNDFVRYLCFIDKPKYGQAFMLEDTCFYLEEQGNVYQYPKIDSYHAGFNAGLETKFLYTYTGIK